MPNIEELTTELPKFPLGEREELARLLNQSISADHEKLAEQESAKHLKIVKERIANHESGNSQMIPFEETMQRVSGKHD